MSRNFRAPKEAEQEEIWLKNTVPRNTKYTTKWSVRIFEEWQATRGNKIAKQETLGFTCSNIESIQDLSVNLIEMSACTLNFWLTKFVGEVVNRNGGRYPPKSLYVIVCGINRHLQEINTENAVNILNKNDQRFFMFRKALDAEMKESTKLGILLIMLQQMVSETCQLAVKRIEWLNNKKSLEEDKLSSNPYNSIDPAPPAVDLDIPKLKNELLNESQPLFERYRAMFSLRNAGGRDAVLALAEGLKCKSALLRHEVAYVLGQMQHEAAIVQLTKNLADKNENPMVRHECAEALGSIAKDDCISILEKYALDQERVVKDSCVVALDMSEYERGDQFQYADSLAKTKQSIKAES